MEDHASDISGSTLPPLGSFEEWLNQRIAAVTVWLEARSPAHTKKPAQLDPWLRELLYWYHGYLAALSATRDSMRRRRRSLH